MQRGRKHRTGVLEHEKSHLSPFPVILSYPTTEEAFCRSHMFLSNHNKKKYIIQATCQTKPFLIGLISSVHFSLKFPSLVYYIGVHKVFFLKKKRKKKKKRRKGREGNRREEKMLAKDSGGANFNLPEEVLDVLPSDPFEQLDVARKITSIALSTRVSALESESSDLRRQLSDKDSFIDDLQAQIVSLDSTLSDTLHNLTLAHQEKDNLLQENASLTNTVKKLNRDVAKLESFRKTLMRSLQDEEETAAGVPKVPSQAGLYSQSLGEDEVTQPPSRASSIQSQVSDIGNSYSEDMESNASRPRIAPGLLLASQTTTPRLTPPGSPPSLSASVSPTRTSKPASPRRHAVSFALDRSSIFSSAPSSQYGSMSGSDAGSQSGRTRVDGKEFFRQVRSRLSYEQFSSFLANVKELNSHKQSKEETLRKADEIFGPDNKDLYAIFEGLITRNTH